MPESWSGRDALKIGCSDIGKKLQIYQKIIDIKHLK